MLIGVLSDSHGKALRVRSAIELFDRLRVDTIIHCGDIGGIAVFDEVAGRSFHFVWGNTDDPDAATRAYVATLGFTEPAELPMLLELAGKKIAVFHGHETGFGKALRSHEYDYILHGHTHMARDERVGHARIINPGALHRARLHTVATLDPAADLVEFHELRP